MKTLFNLLRLIRKEEKNDLNDQLHENLVLDYVEKKFFTAADLWNIQRQKRSTFQRRYI